MRRLRSWLTVAGIFVLGAAPLADGAVVGARAAPTSPHMALNCEYASCAEVGDPAGVFGSYVGHDEPSAVFYSNRPGAGSRMSYNVTLPRDPSPSNPFDTERALLARA